MRGRRLAFILLLIALSIPVSARPAARPAPADVRPMQYLPLVATAPIPVEIVETGRGVLEGYPSDYYVYGYVRNLTLTPLYSVTLELEITIYPYDPGGNPPPYTERVQVDTALPATLPGQINPFEYDLLLGKNGAVFGDLRAVSANTTAVGGALYEPLTVVSLERDGDNLRSTVRNDSTHALHGVHVAVVEVQNATCSWWRPSLDTTTLQPGQALTFQLEHFYQYCHGSPVLVLGQGADR